MPNHVQNRLQVISDNPTKVREVLNFISSEKDGEKMQMDFNKIKPMPDCLQVTSGSLGEMAHELLFGTKGRKFFPIDIKELQIRFAKLDIKQQQEAVDLAIKYQYNLVTYGATTWYDWCNNNWGTKWNAYGQNDERNTGDTIYFQTAWSAPIDLILELSEKFPDVEFQFDYADEDSGSNTGKSTIQNGDYITQDQPPSQSKEGYEIYFELNPGAAENYKLVNGTYQYKEED